MKFTLKDYQAEAVRDVLDRFQKAKRRWHEDRDRHAFSLTATTGAGKTVMAAAVFETLFHGDDEYDFEADPSAVVIWFSDDPALNEQTRVRLQQASDRLTLHDMEIVEAPLGYDKFKVGKIYFLNTQKLSRTSLLVRGHDPVEEFAKRGTSFPELRPDMQSHTIWDIIQNSIEDPSLTLYLVLDEAHRGMGRPTTAQQNARTTIVQRLINGAGAVPAMPIVWGISATVDRFNAAMANAQGRSTLPNVLVDSAKVQDSGLLKDTIILDIPEQSGPFDTVLMRRATDKIKEATAAWADYSRHQSDTELVNPLMVLQVPNAPDHDEIGRALSAIFEQWPELPTDAIAHVFGEHTTQSFGPYQVPYISPERVQESDWVRILIAKDAISTGWDCPRAEVMISFRPAQDHTYITQLLGRIVRTPLARRIPGNERLNSVDCLLPRFDRKTVSDVAKALMKGGAEAGEADLPGRRVLINPHGMSPNPAVPEAVWEKLISLPSQRPPQKAAKPVKRLTALAHELASDSLLADAGRTAHAEMHKVLDAAQSRYRDQIAAARKSVLGVQGITVRADLQNKDMSFDDFLEEADYAVIENIYRRAARVVSPDLARTYAEYLAKQNDDAEAEEEALMEARANIAAMALVPEIKDYLDGEAEKLSKAWLNKYRVAIKSLSDERQESYRQIQEMSAEPADVDLVKPNNWIVPTTALNADGTETPLSTYEHHLLCREDGMFPAEFNSWEVAVLAKEMERDGFIAWYRNPSRSSQDSLGITYEAGGEVRIMRPDFLVFAKMADGSIGTDIIDPHGTQFSDAIPKLRGLAKYAQTHRAQYRRIESIAKVGDKLRVIDLTDNRVRVAIQAADDAKALFESEIASDY
ncbi:type III restriction enzyme, res subunit [Hyphomicrobium nitrativorans NL23]|uniref:Type III restriction enzyme, res subunit n=1 Tax=Hyphomicrobium nitrativorans NL23 TaxID=1029756 RepID=V5SBF5_9HYPH|nr:DEAD/DEAH box helicase family protein [Hyphomicrobium nitrativorans]AHB47853.1 type III restriction enzyme, res subunit [Hyphomicrobium nitrativorans NL23]